MVEPSTSVFRLPAASIGVGAGHAVDGIARRGAGWHYRSSCPRRCRPAAAADCWWPAGRCRDRRCSWPIAARVAGPRLARESSGVVEAAAFAELRVAGLLQGGGDPAVGQVAAADGVGHRARHRVAHSDRRYPAGLHVARVAGDGHAGQRRGVVVDGLLDTGGRVDRVGPAVRLSPLTVSLCLGRATQGVDRRHDVLEHGTARVLCLASVRLPKAS